MFEGMEVSRPRETLSRDLGERRKEAIEGGYCARCYVNVGLQIKVQNNHCPNCGAKLNGKNDI